MLMVARAISTVRTPMSNSMTGDHVDTLKGHMIPALLAMALAVAGGAVGVILV
jgi:hypothetical protein